MADITHIVQKQRDFFNTKQTYDITYRKNQLKKLKEALKQYEHEILQALKNDLNKSSFEAFATEIGLVEGEINFMLKNIRRFAKPQRVRTPLMHFPAKSTIVKEPYGLVLIIAPWNYPFQLAMIPLIGAVATGNCVVLKPSNYSQHTSKVIAKMLTSTFDPQYISVVEGDRHANQELLNQKFDHIVFTGSVEIGKHVMEKAARHLTPVTLELGGKSPCIVEKTADIDLAAKRITWGKLLNSGQTCVAPDYILAENCIKDELITKIKKYIREFYGETPQNNDEYPKIINQKHFDRLTGLISRAEDVWGGQANAQTKQIAPAIIPQAHWDSEIMQEEIFGPILPIIGFEDLEDIVCKINARPKPLALYIFTKSKKVEKHAVDYISYGGGCVNDTIVHLATSHLGFGGIGESGMGTYHGKHSFTTLSHSKGVLKKANWLDIPLRYAPYTFPISIMRKFF